MKRNYQKELNELLANLQEKPTLLLHCCCAPCSSYVLEYLQEYFHITLFFYNPNITEEEEYEKRKNELKRYVSEVPYGDTIAFLDADYEPRRFLEVAKGHEDAPERGSRCERCFSLRLEKTAEVASDKKFDYFCTTLSISPHKNANLLMEIGEQLGQEKGIAYLPSDFKKQNGYKRSIELSAEHNLYRQDYCGCIFSKKQRMEEKREKDSRDFTSHN